MVYPPDALPLITELKPIQRSSEKLFDILHGGEQQLAAHMSKSIAMCFNFGGCGMDGRATSLLGSLSFVQLLQLELAGVGTVETKVQMKKSKYLSLLTEDNFRKWATSNDNVLGHVATAEGFSETTDTIVSSAKVDETTATGIDEDVEKLFGLTTFVVKNNATSSCLPGYICLAYVLRSTTPELFGSCWREPIVGFGSFSVVLAATENSVIKVSKFGRHFSLKTEIAVLRKLNQDEGHDSVPKLIRCGLFQLHLGSTTHKLPSFEIQPKAHNILAALSDFPNENCLCERMKELLDDCFSAIQFIHGRGISHNDLHPNNIMETCDGKALIIDFSVATQLGTEQINGFIGTPTPSTAHSDALKEKRWVAYPFHDHASLWFHLCYFVQQGSNGLAPTQPRRYRRPPGRVSQGDH